MPKPEKRGSGDWQTAGIDAFTGGINSSQRPELIPETDLIQCQNIILKQSRALVDTGYHTFGNVVRGTPQTDFQYYQRSGVSELVLVTTATFYKYATGATQWQYISDGVKTTLTAQANAGATTLTVASITGFANGQFVGVMLDNGTQHQTTVNGAPSGFTITITNAIPAGRNAPIGAALVKAVDLTGTLDFLVSIILVPSNDWAVFTNGIDTPRYYDGTESKILPNLPGGFNTCRVVANYNSTLFMCNTVEGGLDLPQRIRRSDIGDPTNWSTGLAGYDDLFNSSDFIRAAETMGPYLIIYRERSIIRGQYVNTAGKIYDWETTIDGEGAVSGQSVVNLNEQHLVFCNAGLFLFNGGYNLDSFGDKIFYNVFSETGDLNTDFRDRIFAFYVEELDEAWFFYPDTTSETCNVLIRYNVGDDNWTKRKFPDTFVGFGFYQTISAKRWIDVVGPWSAQTFRWDSRTVSSSSPTTHFMSVGLNQVVEYDYATDKDNGTAISVILETKDFFNKDWAMRHDSLQFYARGTNITVEYSTDAGLNFQFFGTVTSANLSIITLSKQFVCDKIRYRFTCSSSNFELDWLNLSYYEESRTMYRGG